MISRADLRDLTAAGHVIGSHLARHPDLFAALTVDAQIFTAHALRRERHAALRAVKKAVRRIGGERYLRFRRAALTALGNRAPGTGDDGP